MATETAEQTTITRKLILHDALSFFTLTAITIALFAVTLFLFHSFQSHRAALATRWSARGLAAFQADKPDQAITAYRTALTYDPDQRNYELMLAQSLARAGRTEESYNYFLGLWESRPGDGFINLQLARLAAVRRSGKLLGDPQAAINYYRASIYGTWEGDAIDRRRAGRLELARYLIAQHDPGAARAELLVAGGNAPDDPQLDITLGKLLDQANSPQEALTYYRKALAKQPKNLEALSAAARLTFAAGDYTGTRKLLERVVHEAPENTQATTLLAQSQVLIQLATPESLPSAERVRRILAEQVTAKKRLADCMAATPSNDLQPLVGRWTSAEPTLNRKALLANPDTQTAAIQLIDDTELTTNQHCAPATGTDALLLLLAKSAHPEAGND